MSKPKLPPKEQAESSSQSLKIKRFWKVRPIRHPAGQFESSDEEDAPPRVPSITSISSEKVTLLKHIRGLNNRLADNLIKIRDLEDDINNLHFKLDQKIAKLARAAGVADVLNQPF